MVLQPDWVGGRKRVVKQGIVIEGGSGERGMGGDREMLHAGVGVRCRGIFQSALQMCPPCALSVAPEIRN